jgi:predicted DNA-binding transcriptional regulator AlpA
MRIELESALAAAQTLPRTDLPELLGALEQVRSTAWMRLNESIAPVPEDRMLNARETAQRLGISVRYLYSIAHTMPFARHMGKRIVFSSNGIEEYLRR